jgi:predicted amidohydrolase
MSTVPSEPSQLRVALAQMDVHIGDVDHNLARAGELVGTARERGAELVLLPELWSAGYDLQRAATHAETDVAVVLPALAALARRHGIYIAGSLLLPDAAGRTQNRAVVHAPDGSQIADYAKVHLFALMDEHHYLVPGDTVQTFPLPWGTTAVTICYDLRFPELFRSFALGGARIMLLPAEWPAVRLAHWQTLVRARAIENQLFVIACNRVGTSGTTAFGGHSMVVDPWGEILVEGDDTESVLMATLELARVDEARARIDILGDRRAELYDLRQLAVRP